MIEKYVAGLCDSDGSIGLHFNKRQDGTYRAAARIKISNIEDIKWIADDLPFNKCIYEYMEGRFINELYAFGDRAVTIINRIKPHLRIKKFLADWVISNHGQVVNNPKELKETAKQIRKDSCLHCDITRFPSRAWLAGYFDGDGCFTERKSRNERYAKIGVWIFDRPILEMIKHYFGGQIYKHNGDSVQWCLYLQPTTIKKFVGHMINHLRIKRHKGDILMSRLAATTKCESRFGESDSLTIQQGIV